MEKLFAYALLKDFNQDAVTYFLDSQMVASLTDHHSFEIICHYLSSHFQSLIFFLYLYLCLSSPTMLGTLAHSFMFFIF